MVAAEVQATGLLVAVYDLNFLFFILTMDYLFIFKITDRININVVPNTNKITDCHKKSSSGLENLQL